MSTNETSDADLLSEFEEAYNGGNYSYDTFEAWSAKVWDALPRLLRLAKDGMKLEKERSKSIADDDTPSFLELHFSILSAVEVAHEYVGEQPHWSKTMLQLADVTQRLQNAYRALLKRPDQQYVGDDEQRADSGDGRRDG